MKYRKGQEVECIVTAASWLTTESNVVQFLCFGPKPHLPDKGERYIVDGFGLPFSDGRQSLIFQEIPDGWNWDSDAFQPVVKTDISVFEDIRREIERGDADAGLVLEVYQFFHGDK